MADTVLSNFTPGIEAKEIDTSRILKVGIIGTCLLYTSPFGQGVRDNKPPPCRICPSDKRALRFLRSLRQQFPHQNFHLTADMPCGHGACDRKPIPAPSHLPV